MRHRADRVRDPTAGGLQGAEIVGPAERGGRGGHGVDVERPWHVPHIRAQKRARHLGLQNQVTVRLSSRRKPRMKIRGRRFHRHDAHGGVEAAR